ncbi:RHS repeat domain-containing protein, partial [Gilliamella sp. Nev3-1]|uniref:RHS repeat domain-containing protein n=2 Tax=unclassified Gilliamella TaxID=2685620 RepID=UPI000A8A6C25
YDNAGQLHTVTYPEVNPEQHHAEKVEQFDYDPTGNKISETQALAPTPFHANIAKGNRLTFFSDKHFEYDRFGNLIAEKRGKDHSLVTHYQYDCRHRLIKVIKPTGLIITYTYDAFNRRTSKTVDGKTTEFIWQGSRLIAETDNDKHWQSYLYEPDSYRPLALVHGNAQQDNIKLYWYQNDHLGTPIALTGSLGDTLYECQYNAYGQIINETYHQDDIDSLPNNPLRFQGQYYDEETGLHYNLNRYYDPFTGRYITQDPIKLMGGWNYYQYVNSDPVQWVDPLGLIKGIENTGSLHELDPVDNLLYGSRVNENLPGATGIPIPNRPTPLELELLSEKHGVEFAVTYKYGKGMHGRGGQYYLHSGERAKVTIPLEKDRILVYHTHPQGTAYASPQDMQIMLLLERLGSPQRSSQIIPSGKAVIRFNAKKGKL